jgi:hypothetical protein
MTNRMRIYIYIIRTLKTSKIHQPRRYVSVAEDYFRRHAADSFLVVALQELRRQNWQEFQWSCMLVYIDENNGDQLTKPFHYCKGSCGEVDPLSPSPSVRGAWTMDMGMVHDPCPLIYLQHCTVVSMLFFHTCSSLLGEIESMQLIVSLVRNIPLILISFWIVKFSHGNM